MITLESDKISITFSDTDLKIKREFSLDKVNGKVQIKDYDSVTDTLVRTINCDVFDLEVIS